MSAATVDPVTMRRLLHAAERHYTPGRVSFEEMLAVIGESGANVSQLAAKLHLSRGSVRSMAGALVEIRAVRTERGPGQSTIYRSNFEDWDVLFS